MNLRHYFFSVALLAFIIGCNKNKEDIEVSANDNFYFNSFENSMDVETFEGMNPFLSDDTPSDGGDSSIVVAGGCIVPHLYFELGPFDEAQNLSFSVYGKAEGIAGGSLSLRLKSDPDAIIAIQIQDNEWTLYETANTLEVPVGEQVVINFVSGGIVPIVSYFDLFEIQSN